MGALASGPALNPADLTAMLGKVDVGPPAADPRARRQQALVAFGRRTNAQPPWDVLMQDAVALVVEILGAELGGAGVVEGETLAMTIGGRRPPAAAAGAPAVAQVHRCPLADTNSMAAYALRTGSLAVSADICKDRRFRDSFLEKLGVAGAMAIPLHVGGRPFGALGVYGTARREFTFDDVAFAETIAHLLSASIARIRVEQKLEQTSAIQSGVLEMLDAMVMMLDLDGRVLDMNRACEQLTQYRVDEIRNKPLWSALSAPEEADLLEAIFRGARTDQAPNEFDGYVLAKDGTRHRVAWSLKALCTGEVQTILMTGTDQTAQAQTKAELEKVKALAEQTTATLAQLCTRLSGPSAPSGPTQVPVETAPADPILSANSGAERRRSFRRAYRYRQAIAPMTDGVVPTRWEFFEVDCWDISLGGIAFFLDRPPDFQTLVVSLGRPPALNHFTAQVVRVARMEQHGRMRYLVGCRFLERVQC
jgi:PAS domain S-box-containing protein